MKTILCFACLCLSVASFSQADSTRKFDFSKPGYFKESNLLKFNKNLALKKIRPVTIAPGETEQENISGGMPNAMNLQQREMFKPKDKYAIGNGLQAFESPLDGMKVISADSTTLFNMPVAVMKPTRLAATTTSP